METETLAQPVKMDPGVKAKWIDALLNGPYKQGIGKLKLKDSGDEGFKHCCLGVLCEIYAKENKDMEWELTRDSRPNYNNAYAFGGVDNGSFHFPPEKVCHWAGISRFPANDNAALETLAGFNDSGKNFVEIADWIKKNL